MKNLDYLLRALKSVVSGVELAIYGPRQEPEYLAACEKLIAALPCHITADFLGELKPDDVVSTFSKYDLFVLPTRGENYGHVILESLMGGTPVLVSDQTPWRATSSGAIETLPLDSEFRWASAIERWASYSAEVLTARRKASLHYAETYLRGDAVIKQNRALFLSVLSG
jgi:glycosyltransferase involved in cell wall biosynthesis